MRAKKILPIGSRRRDVVKRLYDKKKYLNPKRLPETIKNQTDAFRANQLYGSEAFVHPRVARSKEAKIAVILHLYYTDQWELFNQYLRHLEQHGFDLFVTIPKQKALYAKNIIQQYPNAHVFEVPNRGRDVLPFVQVVKLLRGKGYEFILKIHSKRSTHRADGRDWLIDMLENLLPDRPNITNELLTVLKKPKTALVGPSGQYMSLAVNYESNKAGLGHVILRVLSRKKTKELAKTYKDYGFFAGTMFWARMDAIEEVLQKGKFNVRDFQREKGQIDATLAHALERAFCVVPELNKRMIYEISRTRVEKIDYETSNIPDWSDVN